MSQHVMTCMNELRNLNNSKIVKYVVLEEDQQTYPPAIRALMNRYKDIILQNDLLDRLASANEDMNINKTLEQYNGTVDEGFIQYICNMNKDDFNFTQTVVENATRETVSEELQVARDCVKKQIQYQDQEDVGLTYDLKNDRIKGYISYYTNLINQGKLIGYSKQNHEDDVWKMLYLIKNNRQNKSFIKKDEAMALSIAAKYISTLNDHEFIQLLLDTNQITEEQYQSLTRKYKDIPDLQGEVYEQKNWKEISKAQKEATKTQESTESEEVK